MEVIRVSAKQPHSTYINDVKHKFATTNVIELSALEGAITTAVKAADALIHYGYANLKRFQTTVNEEEGSHGRFRGMVRIIIQLEKSAKFDQAAQEFDKNRLHRNN